MTEIIINDEKITFDMSAITISEYRKFAKGTFTDDEDDAVLARAAGKTVEWVQGLSHFDYRRALKAFFDTARAPLDNDPN